MLYEIPENQISIKNLKIKKQCSTIAFSKGNSLSIRRTKKSMLKVSSKRNGKLHSTVKCSISIKENVWDKMAKCVFGTIFPWEMKAKFLSYFKRSNNKRCNCSVVWVVTTEWVMACKFSTVNGCHKKSFNSTKRLKIGPYSSWFVEFGWEPAVSRVSHRPWSNKLTYCGSMKPIVLFKQPGSFSALSMWPVHGMANSDEGAGCAGIGNAGCDNMVDTTEK